MSTIAAILAGFAVFTGIVWLTLSDVAEGAMDWIEDYWLFGPLDWAVEQRPVVLALVFIPLLIWIPLSMVVIGVVLFGLPALAAGLTYGVLS